MNAEQTIIRTHTPDLLEACRNIILCSDAKDNDALANAIQDVRIAIAKATSSLESNQPKPTPRRMTPLETLRHHVSGAIERGEKQAIVEQAPEVGNRPKRHDKPCVAYRSGHRPTCIWLKDGTKVIIKRDANGTYLEVENQSEIVPMSGSKL